MTLVSFQVVFQQGTTKLSVEKDKTSVVSDVGISFTDPRTQSTFFSTDFENHEFHLPKGVKVLSVKKASTERVRMTLITADSCDEREILSFTASDYTQRSIELKQRKSRFCWLITTTREGSKQQSKDFKLH